jgi:hypothetical protein
LEQRCAPVLSCLLADEVRFLIAGGWAVRFHSYEERPVTDLDLLVEFSADNWPKVIRVLEYLIGIRVNTFDELAQRPNPFQAKLDPVDFLTAIGSAFSASSSSYGRSSSGRRLAVASLRHGVSFGEAWADATETSFGDKGLRVRVLSRAHVVLSKEHTNRQKDADDINLKTAVRRGHRRDDQGFR